MSCARGQPCEERLKRRTAFAALGLMLVIFIALSLASFHESRDQVTPDTVRYASYDAVQGKRVFQTYNCMGCHTIVGNGAYFGPDLTKLYGKVGPAWIEAFLPSAGTWPTSAAVRVQLQNRTVAEDAGVDTIEAYLEKYPGAAERIRRRSAHASTMPNLPLSRDDVGHLIAFLKYASQMNTEGWPPVPKVDGLAFPHATPFPVAAAAVVEAPSSGGTGAATEAAEDPVALGGRLVEENGCVACHATGRERLVGPGWGGLYGTDVVLEDGSVVVADDAFLTESILQPDAKVVAGFTAGSMPSYDGMLDSDQVTAIVAYIRSLHEEQRNNQ